MAKPSREPSRRRQAKPSGNPKLAVWKFSSCDGCQLSLLDCEDQLLDVVARIDIAYFLEATRATLAGPYDISLVEGSITTAEEAERIQQIRAQSRVLVAIGACATTGGIQALRNFAQLDQLVSAVYAHPEYIQTLDTATPVSAHVPVDLELHGCPINKHQLLEVIAAFLVGRKPDLPDHSVCVECKRSGTVCVMVSKGEPCLGPVTRAGCGSVCPPWGRGCFGCFGPKESANTVALADHFAALGLTARQRRDQFRSFTGAAQSFRSESARHDSAATRSK